MEIINYGIIILANYIDMIIECILELKNRINCQFCCHNKILIKES
jgi:hypothetical protein